MTIDEAIEMYTSNAEHERTHGNLQGCLDFRQLAEWLKDYKRLKEQEPCEDAISRQAVLDTISELNAISFYEAQEDSKECYYEIRQAIKDLSPVKPQVQTGHWKRISMDKYSEHAKYWYRCDKCGKDNLGNTDWCPNCGVKMIER